MKQIGMACLIVMIGSIAGSPAWGHDRWRWNHGGWWGHRGYYGGIGLELYSPGYYSVPYYPPYYVYPPAVVTVPPPVYIQQAPPAVEQNPNGYWYFCNKPQGYYPYIRECPNGWQPVEPTPSTPR